MKNKCYWVNYKWVINFKVVVDLSHYATKKELNDATGANTSNLVAEGNLIALKA